MKLNVGNIDRGVRIAISAVLVVLFFMNILTGVLGYIALAVAGIFTLTAIVGFCPLYAIFGMSTCPTKKTS